MRGEEVAPVLEVEVVVEVVVDAAVAAVDGLPLAWRDKGLYPPSTFPSIPPRRLGSLGEGLVLGLPLLFPRLWGHRADKVIVPPPPLPELAFGAPLPPVCSALFLLIRQGQPERV